MRTACCVAAALAALAASLSGQPSPGQVTTTTSIACSGAGPEQVRLGSELIAGVNLAPGDWIVESAGRSGR